MPGFADPAGDSRVLTATMTRAQSRDNVRNRYAHLTNYSLNKKSSLVR
jgi:hypothetical protein